jgi:hypothetical protein
MRGYASTDEDLSLRRRRLPFGRNVFLREDRV